MTIEIVNPHSTAITMRVFDQWPLSDADRTEIELIESKPLAIADARIGKLEWRLNLAAKQKQIISFRYSIKRPQGWQLSQTEQSP